MNLIFFYLNAFYFLSFINVTNSEFADEKSKYVQGPSKEECEDRIYRQCNWPTEFTRQELENVRIFLNYMFTVLADIKPDVPLCKRLHIKRDYKCLTRQQRIDLFNVISQLYIDGTIQYFTDTHVKFWPAWHKTYEFEAAHRWFQNTLEKRMMAINPSVTLPYWSANLYASQPERSIVWDMLGHNGSYSNGYCVQDGFYRNLNLIPCVKRHWAPRGVIYPWDCLEVTSNYFQLPFGPATIIVYFPPHLNVGGYDGQFAVRNAPYDFIFFLYHNYFIDVEYLKIQLIQQSLLTPSGVTYRYNPQTGIIEVLNYRTDYLTGTPNVPVRHMYWVGFGDLCWIPDLLIKPINNLMNGIPDPVPTAVKRMPKSILNKYYPSLATGNCSNLLHNFEEVGDCNRECRPIPKGTSIIETEIGRRQLEAYAFDEGFDAMANLNIQDFNLEDTQKLWLDLNKSGYCSPYVTTY